MCYIFGFLWSTCDQKCHEAVFNQPEYAKPVDERTDGYSEEHPKAAGICITCSVAVTRKQQSSISTFFTNKAK